MFHLNRLLLFIGYIVCCSGPLLMSTKFACITATSASSDIPKTESNMQFGTVNCSSCNFKIKPSYSEKFQNDLIDLHEASDSVEAVHFLFKGLDLSVYKEEKIRFGFHVFDPNWWLWAKNKKHFVFTLPLIDVDILSLG